jgi:hypothetical protein
MQIPWYYMWSDNYKFFRELLRDSIKEDQFIIKELYIPQEKFDTELYKLEGKQFWKVSLIKVDAIIKCLNEAKNNSDAYILFTDIDILVKKPVYSTLTRYINKNYDMVFLKEDQQVNFGFILLRITDEVLTFWLMLREKILGGALDQDYINELIHHFPGTHTVFNEPLFIFNNTWDGSSDFILMQLKCSCLGKEFNMAEKIFNAAQHTNVESYMNLVPEEIIPYIYKFQELLYLSHQEAKTAGIL